MKTVFVSYSRQNKAHAHALSEDIKALGYLAWLDEELSGGQVWWEQILERVRACDVFVCAVASESLRSEACRRELAYATALGKLVLPAVIADGVSPSLLPPQLASLQLIDVRESNRESVLSLGRALTSLPATPPLPEPLPPPPPAPISYLGSLAERICSQEPLDFAAQSGVLVDIKHALRDPESCAQGRTLLQQFRHRRELFAVIAEELDLLFSGVGAAPGPRSEPQGIPEPRDAGQPHAPPPQAESAQRELARFAERDAAHRKATDEKPAAAGPGADERASLATPGRQADDRARPAPDARRGAGERAGRERSPLQESLVASFNTLRTPEAKARRLASAKMAGILVLAAVAICVLGALISILTKGGS
jgi:hypothetical protein